MIKSEIGVEIYVNLMSSRCKCLTQFVQLRWRGVMLSGGVAWCCSGGENRRSGVGSWSGGLPIIGLTSPSASIEFEKPTTFEPSLQPGTAIKSLLPATQLPMCRLLMKCTKDWFDRKFYIWQDTWMRLQFWELETFKTWELWIKQVKITIWSQDTQKLS